MRAPACLIAMLAVALAVGCSSSSKIRPAALPKFEPSLEVKAAWKADVGRVSSSVLTPAVVGDAVFAASQDGTLVRIEKGRTVWRIDARKEITGGVGASEALVVVGTNKGEVLAFDSANGKPAWTAQVSSEVLAAPKIEGDLVIVRAGDSSIFALEANHGTRKWLYQRATPTLTLRSSVGVVLGGGGAFAGLPGGKLMALNLANGAPAWETTVALPKGTTELERVADVSSEPVLDGREVCAVAYQGRAACFDLASGKAVWALDMSSSVGLEMDGFFVYVTDDRGYVYAIDRARGAVVWRQDKLLNRGVTRPAVLAERYVAVADAQGYVHVLRRDNGEFVARYSLDSSGVSAPAVPLGSGLVFQTRRGGVYAVGTP